MSSQIVTVENVIASYCILHNIWIINIFGKFYSSLHCILRMFKSISKEHEIKTINYKSFLANFVEFYRNAMEYKGNIGICFFFRQAGKYTPNTFYRISKIPSTPYRNHLIQFTSLHNVANYKCCSNTDLFKVLRLKDFSVNV